MSVSSTEAIVTAFRDEWARVVGALIRRTGDWDLAEECAAEAFEEAARRWPGDGVPDRPGAWLTTVALRRALDRLRRARRGGELLELVGRDPLLPSTAPGADDASLLLADVDPIPDERLSLIFSCCHPALAPAARVALTLRMLGGLSTTQIARAFLVEEATMAKRISRAKAKIAGAGIAFRVPAPEQLEQRLDAVLAVLYLMFNEGYVGSDAGALLRVDLCEEAIRLGRVLAELMPGQSEVGGLLALMLFTHSRRTTRADAAGELVPLEAQARAGWDAAMISEAETVLRGALVGGAAGPYALQAAIAACHAGAGDAAHSDWPQIAALYALLQRVHDTPVVALNRAVAVAMAGDLEAGLEILDGLDAGGALTGYHLLPAARAGLLSRRGREEEAALWYARAMAEAPPDGPEQRFLAAQLQRLDPQRGRPPHLPGP